MLNQSLLKVIERERKYRPITITTIVTITISSTSTITTTITTSILMILWIPQLSQFYLLTHTLTPTHLPVLQHTHDNTNVHSNL